MHWDIGRDMSLLVFLNKSRIAIFLILVFNGTLSPLWYIGINTYILLHIAEAFKPQINYKC